MSPAEVPASHKRVLVLHSFPPTPCLYTFHKGLRELGHDVRAVGPPSDYGDLDAWAEADPHCSYTQVDPDADMDGILGDLGWEPDWIMYLRPNVPFLPRGMEELRQPVVAWLEDEFKFADMYHRLAYYFDLVGSSYPEIVSSFEAHGFDNWACFNYFTASWLTPRSEDTTQRRELDISFIGHSSPVQSRLRCLELEKLSRLSRKGVRVYIREGVYLHDQMDVYRRSKIVFQHSGQGPPNLTYRLGEAMAAGAMVLARRPNRLGGLERPLEEGAHVVYYDDFEEAEDLIAYYLSHDAERQAIAEAGRRYACVESSWLHQVRAFLERHVYPMPPGHYERRRARLERFGVDERRRQIDRAWYFFTSGPDATPVRQELERIPNWQDDAYVRSLYSTVGSPRYSEDVTFALRERPQHVLTYYNHAARLFLMRERYGAKHVLQAIQTAIGIFARSPARGLESDDVEGFTVMTDLRLRPEITQAYLDHLPGEDRRRRLHTLLLAQLYKNRGLVLYESGQFDEARKALLRAAHALPADGVVIAYLARVARDTGDDDEAAARYTECMEIEPYFAEAFEEYSALLLRVGRYDAAVELAQRWLASYIHADATRLGIHATLAEAYIQLGRREEAEGALALGEGELDTGKINTGLWELQRPDGAIAAPDLQRIREAFQQLRSRARASP
jgi:tetratricopeptide (TPR) repeat protein